MRIKKKSHPLGLSRWQGKTSEIDAIDCNHITSFPSSCQEKSFKYQIFICKSCGKKYMFDSSISPDKQDYCVSCIISGKYLNIVN